MFAQYPYLNLNDFNLDYILKAIKEMRYEVTNFVSINAIKYADPIQWNITSQYEKNTIVIDPVTGTAYISVAPVPAGVALTRPEYWTVVFDLQSFVTKANQNLTNHYEEQTTTTATMNTAAGAWVIWGDVLYKALVNITAGDAYVVGSNIQRIVIEDVINAIAQDIADEAQARQDADAALQDAIDDEARARQDAIDDEAQARQDADGDLNDLTTTNKSSLVAAINEIDSDIQTLINNGLVVPEMYGAVGDGVTDDTTAFTSMFNANIDSKIFIPEKTYVLSNIVVTKDNIDISGRGTLDFIASKGGLKFNGDNNRVCGLKFIGNEYPSGDITATASLLHFVGDNNIVRDCEFTGGNLSGVQISGSGNIVESCYFNKCNSHPVDGADWGSIWFNNQSDSSTPMFTGNKVINNIIDNFDYSGICVIGKFNEFLISGNHMKGTNGAYTMGIYMFAGSLDGAKIVNNVIDTIKNEGIVLSESVASLVAKHLLIEGNTVINCTTRGIVYQGLNSVVGGSVSVKNNYVNGSNIGIYFAAIKDFDVSGNYILTTATGAEHTCIYAIASIDKGNVVDNILKSGDVGIYFGCDGLVSNNSINNCTTGVIIFDPNTITVGVISNNFEYCTTAISSSTPTAEAYSTIVSNTYKNCTNITHNCFSILGFEKNVAIPNAFTGTLVNGTVDITVYAGRVGDGWIAIPISGSGTGALTCNYNNTTTKVTVTSSSATDARTVLITKMVNGD